MKSSNLILTTSPPSQAARKPRRRCFLYGGSRRNYAGKERDSETGLHYYGARYLDSKTGRWISGDPAMGEYVPEPRQGSEKLGGMGGVYNTTNLHAYHYAFNNPIRYIDPNGREGDETKTVSEQLSYLMDYVANTKNMTLQEKADVAKNLRNEIINGDYDFDGLITGSDGNEQFINETLRAFLNTSDTGLPYRYEDMDRDKGWRQVYNSIAGEHQNVVYGKFPNRKFINTDGREAVFVLRADGNWHLSTNIRDIGTYNYATETTGLFDWRAGTDHGRWDMNPYFRQFNTTPWYRVGNNYSRSDYNRNGRNNGTGHVGP